MAKKQVEQYTTSHEFIINKNCKVQFNKRANGQVHVKFLTFEDKPVVLTEDTFLGIKDAYAQYKAMDIT